MGALTQVYVDPSIAGNSGTGTIGDPYGDLQYALNAVVRDATNGNQINIKAGTAEILAASLTLATYGTPAEGAPLVIRGYTSAANDGGIGEIDCNGATMFASNSIGYANLAELLIHNFGNNNGIVFSAGAGFWTIYKCKIHKGASTPSSKSLIVGYGGRSRIISCWIYDAGTGGTGIQLAGIAYGNYIYNCPVGMTGVTVAAKNIVVDCATGIALGADNNNAIDNTVYSSTANTGTGISAASGFSDCVVLNNIVEGYSGAGGKGISGVADIAVLGYNAFYNNTTNESLGDVYLDLGNDQTPVASPFTNAATGDFSLNAAVAGAIETAFPGAWYSLASTTNKADIGAVQKGAGAGGSAAVRIVPAGKVGL